MSKEDRETAYHVYMTDAMKSLVKFDVRFYDILFPPKEETRTEKEIISSISSKLNEIGNSV